MGRALGKIAGWLFSAVIIILLLVLFVVRPDCSQLKETEGLEFRLIEGKNEYAVFDIGDTQSKRIKIPEEFNGMPVTEIAEKAFTGEDITYAYIPDSIIKIGDNAFDDCHELESVRLSENITEIGYRVFADSAVREITIPAKVKTIGNKAFMTTPLETITLPEGVETIGHDAFRNCTRLKSVNIGTGVTTIQTNAFLDCSSLETATFADPYGWKISEDTVENSLSDPENAAKLLTEEEYAALIWTKK